MLNIVSKAHSTGPYLEPRECSQHSYDLFLQDPFLFCSSIYAYVFPVDVFRPPICSFFIFRLPTSRKRSGPAKSEYSVRLPSFGWHFDSFLHNGAAFFCLFPVTECFDWDLPQLLYPYDDTVSEVWPRRLGVASCVIHSLHLMQRFSVATDGQARGKPKYLHFTNLYYRACRRRSVSEWSVGTEPDTAKQDSL